MADVSQTELAQQVHASGTRLVLAVTGGGSQAISALVGVPGASRSVLAAFVPYAAAALDELLGARPEEYCSAATARAMAMAAYCRARQYAPADRVCGVACTASLASDRPKRGPHRLHLASQTAEATSVVSLELIKGRRDRAQEELLAAELLLNLVAETAAVDGRLKPALAAEEKLETTCVVGTHAQQELFSGRTRATSAAGNAALPRAVFPGAFHPLHAGHQKMADQARQLLGVEVAYEISIQNVDKLPLDYLEMEQRVRQFPPGDAVWLTRAAQFVDKAELFPGATFVVGVDTIARIGQPRYYGNDSVAAEAAIARIAAAGCRFLVFGRMVDGAFCTLGDLSLPPALATLCQAVPEALFREDVSSTELRRAAREHAAP